VPHLSGGERFVIDGVNIDLSARQALSMALAIQELAANAAQYGSLTVSTGRVHIQWGFERSSSTSDGPKAVASLLRLVRAKASARAS
jgi:two-component sensor histidine kinase